MRVYILLTIVAFTYYSTIIATVIGGYIFKMSPLH